MIEETILKKEAEAFDKQVDERIKQGFIPDLRRLKKVNWFYNNVWRDPEFVKIHLLPKVNFVIDIAKEKGGKVLELGCGCGYLSLELARNGLHITGIDISKKSIEIAKRFAEENPFKENFGSLNYFCSEINSFDYGEEKYDNIVFFGSLHHLPQIDKLMEKIHKAIKKGGNLIVCEPIDENITKNSAEMVAILRITLPTWIPYEKKMVDLNNSESWEKHVNEIFKELTYQEEHTQSPHDNTSASEEVIKGAVSQYFKIKRIEYSDAFINKIIGGIRGENRYQLARFLKFLDNYLIGKEKLPPSFIQLHAVKE